MIASEIMTDNPMTIRDTASAVDAVDILQSMDVRHLPVVDGDGNLVGILSDRDLRPWLGPARTDADDPRSRLRASDLMSSDVVSVELDTNVKDVIAIMLEERIGAVPVIDADGSVVGIVSYVDVLRSYCSEQSDEAERGRSQRKPHIPS